MLGNTNVAKEERESQSTNTNVSVLICFGDMLEGTNEKLAASETSVLTLKIPVDSRLIPIEKPLSPKSFASWVYFDSIAVVVAESAFFAPKISVAAMCPISFEFAFSCTASPRLINPNAIARKIGRQTATSTTAVPFLFSEYIAIAISRLRS